MSRPPSWSHHDIPELAAEKVAEVARLTAERDALAQIKRHIDEVRNGTGWTVQIYGVLLQQCDQYGKTIDTRRAERAEAERDALAGLLAEFVDNEPCLLDHHGYCQSHSHFDEGECHMARARAALAGSGAELLHGDGIGSSAATRSTDQEDQS